VDSITIRALKYHVLLAIHAEKDLVDVYHNIERYSIRYIKGMYKFVFLGDNTHLVHVVDTILDELRLV